MDKDTFCKDKRVALYCRVSTDDQSCDRQERDLLAFAARAGFAVVGTYKERASGTKNDRKERALVLALAQSRQIDAVLVTELTRWGRSTQDLLATLQELNDQGVSIIAERGAQFDLGTAQGKMIAGVLSVLAQFERDLIAERTRSGLAAARARGKQLGRPRGNRTDDKHRSAVLELHHLGFTIRAIASKLHVSKDTVQRCISKS